MRTLLAALALSTCVAGGLAAADATVTHDGKPAFTVALPDGWTSVAVDTKTSIRTDQKHPHIQVWATSAADIATAEKEVAKIVESEVTHFASNTSESLTVAGAPATALIGTGEEADDGDPSLAEVTLFTVGKTVYVLIAHGEGDGAAKQHDTLRKVLASTKPL